MTIFDQLRTIADAHAHAGYLAHYVNDLDVHDRNTLANAKAGDRFVWVLRGCGTALYSVAIGQDARWCTYWLDQGNTHDTPSLTYEINVTADNGAAGYVKPINYDKARRLASLPASTDKQHAWRDRAPY